MKYYRYVDLSRLQNPYLVPKQSLKQQADQGITDNDRSMLSLYILRCITMGVWSIRYKEAQKIFQKYQGDINGADARIRLFTRINLVERRGSRLYACDSLRKTVFTTLDKMIKNKKIYSGRIKQFLMQEELEDRDVIHIFEDMYCCPPEAEAAYHRLCPPWKSFNKDEEKNHLSNILSLLRETRVMMFKGA